MKKSQKMIEWLQISKAPTYEISSDGKIRRLIVSRGKKPKILKPWLNSQGYEVVRLMVEGGEKRFMVHRLVCEAFNGPSDKEVDHIEHKE